MSDRTGNKVGRPSSKALASNKKGGRKPGRPKGDKAIMDDFKSRILSSPKSRKVLTAILDAALDGDHKHQAVAWKLVMDRIAPVSSFESKDKAAGAGLSISITTLGGATVTVTGDAPDDEAEAIEGEFEEL